jgi:hypothetical protein
MMWALDHISTGLPGLDRIIDGLRWGDNVVWQVEKYKGIPGYGDAFMEHALAGITRLFIYALASMMLCWRRILG